MDTTLVLRSESRLIPETTFQLTRQLSILGRSLKCDFVLKHETVSRRHAEIALAEKTITVRDLESRNGVFVDDKRILQATVQISHHVKFGGVVFRLTTAAAQCPDPGSEIETASSDSVGSAMLQPNEVLTKAQRQVLDLLLQGLVEKEVARKLKISPTTVHNQIQAIYRRLGVHSRAELLIRLLGKQ